MISKKTTFLSAAFLILFIFAVGFSGCLDNIVIDIDDPSPAAPSAAPSATPSAGPSQTPAPVNTPANSSAAKPGNDNGTISIASFNVQIFGESKAEKAEIMNVLAGTVQHYDIIGIQEIRDRNGTALPALVELVNSGVDESGEHYAYDYVVSDRLGRSSSKEQYAYIYNTKKVYVTSEPWVYPDDEKDYFERAPYIVSFAAVNGDFEAVLALIHTKPDDATNEIGRLDDVLDYAQSVYTDKENFLVMGDFNADGSYFNESSASDLKSDDYVWLIGNDVVTTTKTNNTYDRIVITDEMNRYFNGNAGVYDIKTVFGLNQSQLTAVSDHYPVYAEFYAQSGEATAA